MEPLSNHYWRPEQGLFINVVFHVKHIDVTQTCFWSDFLFIIISIITIIIESTIVTV